MIPLLKAEFRKLLTIRSTYILSILALLLLGLIVFYGAGYRQEGANEFWMSGVLSHVSNATSIFLALIAILLASHEYRYNTIMYTLTSANSRTKVLLAKLSAMTIFSLGFMAIMTAIAVLLYVLGVAVSPTAEFTASQFLWRDLWPAVYYAVAYGLLGLALAMLLRHVVGAIASLFIIPTVEGLLSLLLKDNTKYLPFHALEEVNMQVAFSAGKAALIFTLYLVATYLLAWYLFLRRDAN